MLLRTVIFYEYDADGVLPFFVVCGNKDTREKELRQVLEIKRKPYYLLHIVNDPAYLSRYSYIALRRRVHSQEKKAANSEIVSPYMYIN